MTAAAMIALAYYHPKLYDTAEIVLDDVFKRGAAKNNAQVYYVYGLIYDKTRRPAEAALAYQKAVDIDGNHVNALINLGVVQLRNKQYDQAIETFLKVTSSRTDAVTMTQLGSAYRGRSGDFPADGNDRAQLIVNAEDAYKRAITADRTYGPASYNLALLYLDADPFPENGAPLDTLVRLGRVKTYLDTYHSMAGFEQKLFDERAKDVEKAIKREEKRRKNAAKAAASGNH